MRGYECQALFACGNFSATLLSRQTESQQRAPANARYNAQSLGRAKAHGARVPQTSRTRNEKIPANTRTPHHGRHAPPRVPANARYNAQSLGRAKAHGARVPANACSNKANLRTRKGTSKRFLEREKPHQHEHASPGEVRAPPRVPANACSDNAELRTEKEQASASAYFCAFFICSSPSSDSFRYSPGSCPGIVTL